MILTKYEILEKVFALNLVIFHPAVYSHLQLLNASKYVFVLFCINIIFEKRNRSIYLIYLFFVWKYKVYLITGMSPQSKIGNSPIKKIASSMGRNIFLRIKWCLDEVFTQRRLFILYISLKRNYQKLLFFLCSVTSFYTNFIHRLKKNMR